MKKSSLIPPPGKSAYVAPRIESESVRTERGFAESNVDAPGGDVQPMEFGSEKWW